MKVEFGWDAALKAQGRKEPIMFDDQTCQNPHMVLLGGTGSGKTYNLRKLIANMLASARASGGPIPRFHVFDVHGDIEIDGCDTVRLNATSSCGMNPLWVNPDPEFGGPRRAVDGFITIMNKSMMKLGPKQEAALRNACMDTMVRHGFNPDVPDTWIVDESLDDFVSDGSDGRIYLDVPRAEKDEAKKFGARPDWVGGKFAGWWIPVEDYHGEVTRWPPKVAKRRSPNVQDVLLYARSLLQAKFLGSGLEVTKVLADVNRKASACHRKRMEVIKQGGSALPGGELAEQLEQAKTKLVEAFTEYVNAVSTGAELDLHMKYDSEDVLKSVVDRLENILSVGVFKARGMPFDESCPVWRYDISPLSQQKLFALFRLEELFAQARQRGEQKHILDYIVLDEAHVYADDDPNNVMLRIGREARKFGLGQIMASQSAEHFPPDMLKACGTKIILGLDELDWRSAMNKMMVPKEALQWVANHLQRGLLVQTKAKPVPGGEPPRSDWRYVATV